MLRHHFKIIVTLSTNCLIVALILAFGSLEIKDTNLVACMLVGVILEFQYNFNRQKTFFKLLFKCHFKIKKERKRRLLIIITFCFTNVGFSVIFGIIILGTSISIVHAIFNVGLCILCTLESVIFLALAIVLSKINNENTKAGLIKEFDLNFIDLTIEKR